MLLVSVETTVHLREHRFDLSIQSSNKKCTECCENDIYWSDFFKKFVTSFVIALDKEINSTFPVKSLKITPEKFWNYYIPTEINFIANI